VTFGNLGYADHARASYAEFARLRDAGIILTGTRFQVDLVPAHSVLWLFVVEDQQAALDPIYNTAVGREIDAIAAAILHDDLAIQLDIASAVFARLERAEPTVYGRTKAEMLERFSTIIAGLADRIPADVELLFHFCYGDANHRHAIEPTDMGDMVEMANRLSRRIARPIQLIHMPVPRDRSDVAYFEPLRGLALRRETELALGLVHYTDGIAGAWRRMDTARRFIADFAVATECGFGRRAPETIPELLRLHVAAADYV
jgi:methionine synthase II (cobalamin-independent)